MERTQFRQALRAHALITLPTDHARASPDTGREGPGPQTRTENIASAQKKAVCGHAGHTAGTTCSLHLKKTQRDKSQPQMNGSETLRNSSFSAGKQEATHFLRILPEANSHHVQMGNHLPGLSKGSKQHHIIYIALYFAFFTEDISIAGYKKPLAVLNSCLEFNVMNAV